MGKHEDVVATCSANASMLEGLVATSADGWLQQCCHLPGKDDDGTGANRAGATREVIGSQA
jgi:hypothetical protein